MAHPVRIRYWSAVIADFRRSGLTQVEFCRRRQISLHSFRSWLYSLNRALPTPSPSTRVGAQPFSAPSHASTPPFLPVHVRSDSVATADYGVPQSPAMLELVVGAEHHVRVPVGFDPATLGRLLDLLESRS